MKKCGAYSDRTDDFKAPRLQDELKMNASNTPGSAL
jgi:hypothetical protein